MTVTSEELMAYADGELSDKDAARIAREIAADPDLAARLDAETALRTRLKGHLDPVAQEAVPDDLVAMIAAAQAEDEATAAPETDLPPPTEAAPPRAAPVLDFAAAKARREEERKARAKAKKAAASTPKGFARPGTPIRGRKGVPMFARPGLAAGLAATLVLGVMLGTSLNLGSLWGSLWGSRGDSEAGMVEHDGQLVAQGALAKGLETQLASAQDTNADLRILTSFQRSDGTYCRAYSASATSGIACHEGGSWVLERTMAGGTSGASASAYRQAGSAEAELMAAAQDMAGAAPLDAEAERAARDKGW